MASAHELSVSSLSVPLVFRTPFSDTLRSKGLVQTSPLQNDATVYSRCEVLTEDGDPRRSNVTWTEGIQLRMYVALSLTVGDSAVFHRHRDGVAPQASTNVSVDRTHTIKRKSTQLVHAHILLGCSQAIIQVDHAK